MQIWPCHKVATLSNYQLYQKGIKRTTKKYRPPCFCEKKIFIFCFLKEWNLLHKSQIPIVMNEIRMLKKKQMIWIVQYLNQITKNQNKKFCNSWNYFSSAVTCTKKLVVVKKKLAFSGHFSIWKPALVFWKK